MATTPFGSTVGKLEVSVDPKIYLQSIRAIDQPNLIIPPAADGPIEEGMEWLTGVIQDAAPPECYWGFQYMDTNGDGEADTLMYGRICKF